MGKRNTKKGNQLEKKEERNNIKVRGARYEGPIPPSSELAKYEKVLTGAADRIITMAEEERRDRNKNTRLELYLHYGSRMFSQLMFAIISLGAVGAGVYLLISGKKIGGLASIITGLGVIGGGFFMSRNYKPSITDNKKSEKASNKKNSDD